MIVLRGLGVCCIYESSNTDKKTALCLAVTVREEDNGLQAPLSKREQCRITPDGGSGSSSGSIR